MKRTREWWAGLTAGERSKLVALERVEKDSSGYGAGGLIPDDCCECGFCSTPHSGSRLCPPCLRELLDLIDRADSRTRTGVRYDRDKG